MLDLCHARQATQFLQFQGDDFDIPNFDDELQKYSYHIPPHFFVVTGFQLPVNYFHSISYLRDKIEIENLFSERKIE